MIEPNKELSAEALLDVLALADAAMAVYTSEELYIRFANDAMLRLWDKSRDVLGKPLAQGVPELVDQPYISLLKNVWKTGTAYFGTEIPTALKIDQVVTTAYFDFEYRAILDEYGKTCSIIHTAKDVTARVNFKTLVKQKQEREQQLYEELQSANEELQVLNEELRATNEELNLLNSERHELNEELKITNDELKSLNEEYLSTNEQLTSLNLELSAVNSQAVLAKQAANLGMFDLDVVTDTLEWDVRCKELFGLSPNVQVTYSDDFIKGLHPEDKDRVVQAVADAYNFNVAAGSYDIDFRTIGAGDKQQRWVRAIGQVFFNDAKEPLRFIGTAMDITEQKRDDQRKNDFIGMVSHELKTPLTSLSAYLQVLQGKAAKTDDDFTTNAINKSMVQVKKMSTMINGFLNVSRLESGKIYIDKKLFDIAELLKELQEETQAVIISHQVIFHPCQPVNIYGDRDKIGQVINNFISNAVKYSPPSTIIELTCTSADGQVWVAVKDQGMGIAPNDINRLFDRYYRVQGIHTETIPGFGIGLYLSAEIIERHNGKIGVDSELGIGSTFWFAIPQGIKR